jgi:hypothetical protein
MAGWRAVETWDARIFSRPFRRGSALGNARRESDPIYARTSEHMRTVTIEEFAERVLQAGVTNDFYMVARNKNVTEPALARLFDDIRLPDGWFEAEHLVGSSALWFGPAGTVTPLHHDASSILFCQVYGTKRLRLASPLEVSLFDGALSMYSSLNPENPGDDPRATSVTFKDVTLAPGEGPFIPAGWWHHVRALEVSISFAANHFARPNNFDSWYRPRSRDERTRSATFSRVVVPQDSPFVRAVLRVARRGGDGGEGQVRATGEPHATAEVSAGIHRQVGRPPLA